MKNLAAYLGVLVGLIAISPTVVTIIDILLYFFFDTTIVKWSDGKGLFVILWTCTIFPFGGVLLLEALDDIK